MAIGLGWLPQGAFAVKCVASFFTFLDTERVIRMKDSPSLTINEGISLLNAALGQYWMLAATWILLSIGVVAAATCFKFRRRFTRIAAKIGFILIYGGFVAAIVNAVETIHRTAEMLVGIINRSVSFWHGTESRLYESWFSSTMSTIQAALLFGSVLVAVLILHAQNTARDPATTADPSAKNGSDSVGMSAN